MSEIIPPFLSTPPPILDEDEDDFDDFVTHNNYICDFPTKLEEETKNVDINSNKSGVIGANIEINALPNEVPIMSKSEDVPSNIIAPSEKINGINDYREEPPEICSDDDDDFGDFEYNNTNCIEIDKDLVVNNKLEDYNSQFNSFNGFIGGSTQDSLFNSSSDLDIIKENSIDTPSKSNYNKIEQSDDLSSTETHENEVFSKINGETEQNVCEDSSGFFEDSVKNNEISVDDLKVFENDSFSLKNVDCNADDILELDESLCTVAKNLPDDENYLENADISKQEHESIKFDEYDFKLCSESDKNVDIPELLDSNEKSYNISLKLDDTINENLFTFKDITEDSIENSKIVNKSQEISFCESIENDDNLEKPNNFLEIETFDNASNNLIHDGESFFDFKTCSDTNAIFPECAEGEINYDDDFADFESNAFNNPTTSYDDDFGEFVGPEEQKCNINENSAQNLILNEADAYEKSKIIIEDMFKFTEITNEPYFGHNFVENDSIFTEIKDVTETNALSYLWSKSKSQKTLLNALHIDSRNVLYGGGINACMPKFASNLSSAPLEPIKFDVSLTSASSSQQSTSTKEIPSVVFDWKESGLANPLDSPQNGTVLLDLEQLVTTSSEIKETYSEVSLDEWETWLQTVSKEDSTPEQTTLEPNSPSPEETVASNKPIEILSSDNISINSLQLNTTSFNEENSSKDFPEPLGDIFNQILKPELTVNIKLRETHIHETHIHETHIPQTIDFTEFQASTKIGDDFDDFSDFISSQPNLQKPNFDVNFKPVGDILLKDTNINANSKDKNLLDTNEIVINSELREEINISQDTKTILKPTPVLQVSSEINWPNPGITDDELERLENYSRLNKKENTSNEINKLPSMQEKRLTFTEKSIVVPANRVVLPSKEVMIPPNNKIVISKELVLPILESSPRKFNINKRQDDDEWTDFISSNSDRISTPELPLSIPQLKQIQAPKLPIPVITPLGLKQTKIPSSMPILQPKISHVPFQAKPPLDGYQPSIISHQYSMQMNQNVFLQNNYQTTTIPANIAHVSNGFNHDEEEWSDFMCSQPVNITPQTKTNLPHVQKVIPSISSMPDLNFATANKYRHFNK